MQPKDRLLLQGLTCILTQKSYRCKLYIQSRYEDMHKDDSWRWKSSFKHRERCVNVSTERKLGERADFWRAEKDTRASLQPPVGGSVSAAGVGEFRVAGWSGSKRTLRCLTSATSFRLTNCFLSGLVLSAVHPKTPPWSLKRKKNTLLKPFGLCSHAETGGWWDFLSKVLT